MLLLCFVWLLSLFSGVFWWGGGLLFYFIIYLLFQRVLHDWCNKGRGVCYTACRMVHIKDPLLANRQCVFSLAVGAGRSSEVERSLMVRWVVGSILHGGGPIELFLVPASAPRLV